MSVNTLSSSKNLLMSDRVDDVTTVIVGMANNTSSWNALGAITRCVDGVRRIVDVRIVQGVRNMELSHELIIRFSTLSDG